MRTAVVVLGDLGRSPRMQYHALALAVNEGDVDLVGLEGAPVHAALTAESRLHTHRLSDRGFRSRATGGRRRYVWMSAARATLQAGRLLATLLRLPKPDVILVQSPPAAPTLAVAWLAARLSAARASSSTGTTSRTPSSPCRWASTIAPSARWRAANGGGAVVRMRISRSRTHSPSGCGANGAFRRRCSTIGRPRSSRSLARASPTSCGSGWRAISILAPPAFRSSCARRAGHPMRISICCSRRSSAPNGCLHGRAKGRRRTCRRSSPSS